MECMHRSGNGEIDGRWEGAVTRSKGHGDRDSNPQHFVSLGAQPTNILFDDKAYSISH